MKKDYFCPYCGIKIEPDKVLFFDKSAGSVYQDRRRSDFLESHGVTAAQGFNGLYYRVTEKNICDRDDNGFPRKISVALSKGIIPSDLADEEDNFDDESEDFDEGEEKEKESIVVARFCPECHCRLPRDFGLLDTFHVSMFGGRASGKTAYIVNLIQQLNEQLSQNGLGSVRLEEDSAMFWNKLVDNYSETGIIPPTPATKGLMPVICKYTGEGANAREAFIILTDIAGEGTGDETYMARHQGISEAETMLLMVDPNMFNGGVYDKVWRVNHGLIGKDDFDASKDYCDVPLTAYLADAGKLCSDAASHLKNIIVVVTKMDMLLTSDKKFFSSGDIELLNNGSSRHRGKVNLGVMMKVAGELKFFFKKRFNVDILEKVGSRFGTDKKINLLCVSTSTIITDESEKQFDFESRYQSHEPKHRIIEPFLMILWRCNLIKGVTPDGEIRMGDSTLEEQTAATVKPGRKGFFSKLFGGGKK